MRPWSPFESRTCATTSCRYPRVMASVFPLNRSSNVLTSGCLNDVRPGKLDKTGGGRASFRIWPFPYSTKFQKSVSSKSIPTSLGIAQTTEMLATSLRLYHQALYRRLVLMTYRPCISSLDGFVQYYHDRLRVPSLAAHDTDIGTGLTICLLRTAVKDTLLSKPVSRT